MANLTVFDQSAEWDHFYARLSKPNLSAAFSNVLASTMLFSDEAAKAEVAIFEDGKDFLFHPYIRRSCPYQSEYSDLCSPYEFGGFWFNTTSDEKKSELLKGFEPAFKRYALQKNIVSEFCRINPFCDLNELVFSEYETIHADNHVVIPLVAGYEAVWNEFSGTRRTQIRQGQNNGLRIELSDDIETFIEIYHKRLDALNSYKFYYFDQKYLAELIHKKIVFVYDSQNEICSAQVWLQDRDVLFYFLSADVLQKRDQYAGAFAIHEMIKYAISNGQSYIHLGGGTESLNVYKKRFSPHSIAYFQAKKVFNARVYKELVEKHTSDRGQLINKGYFPLYRLDTDAEHKLSNKRRYTATENI